MTDANEATEVVEDSETEENEEPYSDSLTVETDGKDNSDDNVSESSDELIVVSDEEEGYGIDLS